MNQHIQTRPLEPDGNSVYLDYGPQLPERYYQNKIVALVRDPECIFAYWELSAIDQLRIADFGLHNCKWILRVNNLSTNTPEDISLNTPADPDNIPADKGGTPLRLRQGNWYLKVYPDTQYQLEIGIFTPDGKYIPLVKSNIVTTPRKTRAGGVASISSYQTIPTLLILLAMLISSCATIPTQPTTKPEAQTLYTETGAWIGLVGKDSIKGIEIIDIYFNSPAQQASVKKGDIIVGCNNRKTTNTQELLATLQTQKPDDTVKIKLTRIEEQVTVISGTETTTITLDEFNKKYQDFIDKGSPPDKLTFTAGKKEVIKELDVKLATAPKVFRKVAPPSEPKPEMRGEKKAGWMGISMEPVKDLTKFGVQSSEFGGPLGHPVGGLKISSVSPSSPAEKGGLKVQDIVLKYDGNGFEGDDSKYREKMADYIKEKGSGAEITLTVLRVIDDAVITPPQKSDDIIKTVESLNIGDKVSVVITKSVRQLNLKITLGTRMTTPDTKTEDPEPNDKIHPELTSYTTPIEILARQIMTATNITDKSVEIPPLMAGYDDLIKRYTDDQKWDDGFRISDMRYMHRDPFKIPKICDDFLYDLVTKHPPLDTIIRRLDEPITDDNVAPVELETGISLEEHCDQLEKLLETADKYRREAFAGLTEDDYNFLQDNIIGFTERWVRDFHFSEPDEIAKRGETDKRVIQLCSYVNYQKLFTAGEILAYSLSPNYNDGLQKDIEAAGKDKEGILFSKDTPFGKIIISGKGNSRYLDQAAASPALMRGNAAIIIDLDGDDFYANRLGSSTKNQPFSIIIDYSGDDRYSSYENGSQGTGIMGIGILFDMDGDDTYIGQKWAQGSGLLGVGILVDVDGKDSYKGQEFVQGAGLFGIGILLSLDGDDIYQANQFSQGFAGPKAFGLLLDFKGNDSYYATGKYPSGYGDTGTFDGWSQGCGTGFRCYADWSMSRSGGIGILIDGNGNDTYEAGTFSQGGGYFFGWGMLYDGDGDDKYLGTRYAQGFAAHSAIGYFLDEGGNDQYKTLWGVNAGLSWDLTGVVFIDKAGDDVYDAGGFSRGASAHNGFCLFMDLGGKDIYKDEVAKVGGNSYHGGSSFSIFLDQGPEEDTYTKRPNNAIEVEKEYSIFIDTDKTIDDLIKDDAFKTILKNKIENSKTP